MLGIAGAMRHWRADRRTAIAMTFLVFTFTLALVFYLNFKYGYSLHSEQPIAGHEVRQRDYFFMVSFALWGIWVAMGLAAGIEWVAEQFRLRQPDGNASGLALRVDAGGREVELDGALAHSECGSLPRSPRSRRSFMSRGSSSYASAIESSSRE